MPKRKTAEETLTEDKRQQSVGCSGSEPYSAEIRIGDFADAIKKAEKLMGAARTARNSQKSPGATIEWQDNGDVLDNDLLAKSEAAYIDIANTIVKSATDQLREQNSSKNTLKMIFTIFFVALVGVQYLALAVLLFIRTFQSEALLSDAVIIAYISSVFLETLGAVVIMIRYAFASDQETKVLQILNSIISSFQKFPK